MVPKEASFVSGRNRRQVDERTIRVPKMAGGIPACSFTVPMYMIKGAIVVPICKICIIIWNFVINLPTIVSFLPCLYCPKNRMWDFLCLLRKCLECKYLSRKNLPQVALEQSGIQILGWLLLQYFKGQF